MAVAKIIFTVDVEGHVGKNPIEKLIYGRMKDGTVIGIDMIMDCLDEHGVTGLFFVDIAEAWEYGEQKVANILRHIDERGHDVGVHIHPDHMADKKRLFLSEYSYEEQTDIIKKCTDFYKTVLDKDPKAFRAGKYGANWDTLDILAKFGYKADFSEFYGQKWCRIAPACTKSKMVRLENGLLEIPVTSYQSFRTPFYSRFDKMDVENCYSEFRHVLDNIVDNMGYNVIVLFAHSFSLCDWKRDPDNPKFNKCKYDKFYKQIEYVSRKYNENWTDLDGIINIKDINVDGNGEFFVSKGLKAWRFFFCRCIQVLKDRLDVAIRTYIG